MSAKRPWSIAFLLVVLVAVATGPALAGSATLLRDINPVGVDRYDESGVEGNLLSLGRVALLPVREMSSGRELWVSDGTDAGTRPLLDLCPGECSSEITLLGKVGTTGLLTLGTHPNDMVLWRSDGTPAGTFPLFEEDAPRSCASRETAATGSAFYFTAEVGDGCGLWKTDGTRAGTVPLRQFTTDDFDGLGHLTAVGDQLYFVTGTWAGTHPEIALWRTDGTEEGTLQLAVWTASNTLADLVAAGSRLFFVAPGPVANGGRELWVSDGTPAGTRPVTGFTPLDPFVSRTGNPTSGFVLQAVDNQLCFLANDGVTGREVWCSDGTPAGTRRVTGFTLVSPFLDLERWRVEKLGQRLVFPANDGTSGTRLWTTTGQPASTTRVESSPELALNAELVRAGARLFFLGNRDGNQLWASDGTNAGTRMVHRVCAEECGIASLTPLLGKLFFGASDLSDSTALWVTDGSEPGTRRLVEVGSVYDDDGLIPLRAVQVGDHGLLPMEDGNPLSGVSLWSTDGTPAGTSRVTRIGGNGESSSPRELVPVGSGIRFLTTNAGVEELWSSLGTEESTVLSATGFSLERLVPLGNLTLGFGYFALWRSDGTPEGTYRLVTEEGNVADAVSLSSRVVFVQRLSEEPDFEVWSTDGTLDGTRKIFEMPAEFSYLSSLTVLDGKAYFVTIQPDNDQQLWETDGTAAGTRAITTQEHLRIETSPLRLARVGSTFYFIGDDDQVGKEVWRADGTPGGTRSVAEGSLTNIADIAALQGSLYIVAARNEYPYPYGLWKSDGTDAGTVLVAELPRPETSSSWPAQFTLLGSHLYFVVERELWRTDGSAQGTVPVLDAEAAGFAPDPRDLTILNGRLYFSAADQAHGREVWEANGTTVRPVQDIAPGALSSNPQELVASGGKLYFTADDGVHGREPWVYVPTGSGCTPSERALCLGGRFRVEADWRDFEGGSGRATAVALTGDTGYFWFFDPANVEVILKVLDGQGLNGHHWVFYGALSSVEYTLTVTDTQTGAVRRYINPAGQLGSVADTQAFGPLGAHLPGVMTTGPSPTGSDGGPRMGLLKAVAEGSCAPSSTRLCLNDGRFAVEARWKDFQGNTGTGKAVPLSGGDTGYFWFFDQDNVEVVLKVLDGRPLNGKFWVFYGALSTVEYTLTVTDTVTGTVKTYTNPSGKLASVADTGAF